MKAVHINSFSDELDVEYREVADAGEPASDEIVVQVAAAGVNRADLMQARGLYPPPDGISTVIPGLEFAGEIITIGDDVKSFAVGDRVFGITAGEAQAERVTVAAAHAVRVPDNINIINAAAFPEAFITAHDALFARGDLQTGDTVLIHAVGSGVGIAALQIAKQFGCRVIGTSRTQDKLDRCIHLGLDDAIVVAKPAAFADQVNKMTDGQGADVIVDLVGASYFAENLRAAAMRSRLVLIGLTGGSRAEIDLALALRKRLSIIGTVLRSRSKDEKSSAVAAFAREVVPRIADESFTPVIDTIFDAADVADAYRHVATNMSFGKVVLRF